MDGAWWQAFGLVVVILLAAGCVHLSVEEAEFEGFLRWMAAALIFAMIAATILSRNYGR